MTKYAGHEFFDSKLKEKQQICWLRIGELND